MMAINDKIRDEKLPYVFNPIQDGGGGQKGPPTH